MLVLTITIYKIIDVTNTFVIFNTQLSDDRAIYIVYTNNNNNDIIHHTNI